MTRWLFQAAPFVLLAVGCAPIATEEEETETVVQDVSAPTCNPSLASGAVPSKHRAMLDTIAFTEGTARSCGQDGYNTGFAFNCFTSCASHPNIVWSASGYRSSASGRYQFLNTTWAGLGLPTFSPKNQDIAAMRLVARRGVSLPETRALDATEFANAMRKLALEWASLPFSPYGQPVKTLAATRAKYCSIAGCDGASPPPSTPAEDAGIPDQDGGTLGDCVVGSNYCGGNKVAGDPNSLYRCTGGGAGEVIRVCLNGCQINPGDDDTCAD